MGWVIDGWRVSFRLGLGVPGFDKECENGSVRATILAALCVSGSGLFCLFVFLEP